MQRRSRLLLFSLAASAPVIGMMVAVSPAANASSAPSASARAHALTIARNYLRHLSIGQHATDHAVRVNHPGVSGLTQVSSTNWAGYADDNAAGNTYTSLAGNWTEPTGTCTSTTSLAVFWVGIDGFTSGSVEQDGTLIECSGGRVFYFTWWEMFPTNSIQVVGSSVRPGDAISASVVRSGSTYTLKVTDSTHTANSFTKTETCSTCANSSAEWIAEAPSGSGGVEPLTNFHSWTLSSATVKSGSTSGVISSFPDDELTMINGSNAVKASTGALNASGNGFTVTWVRST
jgi:hypothetical protein